MTTADAIRATCDATRDLLLRKNADYGDSAFKPPLLAPDLDAQSAILVRLSDKLQRFVNLQANEAQVDESLDDTIQDMVGYLILLMIARGK